VTKGVGDTVSGVTGGLGEGVGKLGKGDVVGGLGSTVGGVGKGVGGLASGKRDSKKCLTSLTIKYKGSGEV
jgi:hypothetical protein